MSNPWRHCTLSDTTISKLVELLTSLLRDNHMPLSTVLCPTVLWGALHEGLLIFMP